MDEQRNVEEERVRGMNEDVSLGSERAYGGTEEGGQEAGRQGEGDRWMVYERRRDEQTDGGLTVERGRRKGGS